MCINHIITLRNAFLSTGYKYLLRPFLFLQEPEKVHDRFIRLGSFFGKSLVAKNLLNFFFSYSSPMLEQEIAGIRFKNPVGLAAGFDKDAQLVNVLQCIGFGFAELGSVTGEPCAGNPKPRLWRLPKSKSIIVYYGLKNEGALAISKKLKDIELDILGIPIGISAAKTNCKETVILENGIADYLKVLKSFKHIGDYYTINISCPNAYGGLDFSEPKRLEKLLQAMKKEKLFCKPVFLKLSPDLTLKELDALIAVALEYKIKGVICSNLVKKKENALLAPSDKELWIYGGVSGKPVKKHALAHVAHIYKKTKGKLIIIGCGGIFSAEDVYEYIQNGASLVQLITGMIYEGPQLISTINIGLVKLLKKDGYKNISEVVGSRFKQPNSDNLSPIY